MLQSKLDWTGGRCIEYSGMYVVYSLCEFESETLALQQERYDRFAALGIIFELLLVVPVLALSPHSHLIESSHCEEGRRQSVCHGTESDPGQDFVCVVRARHEIEQDREGVAGGERDATLFGSCRSEVSESDVDAEITQFGELKQETTLESCSKI